ncbi:methionine ABC transporter ATP-binding protein [Tannockella kyphosi]|uniref:methionine ABC transporter ATP-binding protein n=1 Tax=Tannockella kyphosi TaxID=2899121 RepID=UPI0020130C24|nr:ATP-binding cassette domain-containing protein [Tannockella kyphosi]
MITFKNVSKTFYVGEKEVKAVDDVSLTIDQGEIFGIIGYSGAGKSTLIRIANQLEQQDSGSVFIGDVEINKLSKKELLVQRSHIGMIFQHFNLLWSRTVRDNIALPLEFAGVNATDIASRVEELIELVGLTGKEADYPSTLSGGQKQRVAIARALANNPKILLCDEATSALDPQTTESILDLLKEINQKLNLTIMLITHQMEVVEKLCHRMAIMVDGKIVEVGDTTTLFEHPSHETTKRFVQTRNQSFDEDTLHQTLKKVYNNGSILRLTFKESIAKKPILSTIIKDNDVPISIVHANLTNTLTSSFGVMYVYIEQCDCNDYQKVVQQLMEQEVTVEVI